jgi:hypothetical protein
MSIYKCQHFEIEELVPPELMSMPEEYLWQLFNEDLLISIDRLRSALGRPITINNWKSGGKFKWRGYRTNSCKIGAKGSMHRIGCALDMDIKGMSAEEVRTYLKTHQNMYPEITRIERNTNWLHIDCMPRKGWTGIKFFNP